MWARPLPTFSNTMLSLENRVVYAVFRMWQENCNTAKRNCSRKKKMLRYLRDRTLFINTEKLLLTVQTFLHFLSGLTVFRAHKITRWNWTSPPGCVAPKDDSALKMSASSPGCENTPLLKQNQQ